MVAIEGHLLLDCFSVQSSWWQPEEVAFTSTGFIAPFVWVLLLIVVVMSKKYRPQQQSSAKGQISLPPLHRPKRCRSISVSADLEVQGGSHHTPTRSAVQQYLRICEERNRTISATDCIENYLRSESMHFSHMFPMGKSLSTLQKNFHRDMFPFCRLPDVCKLKVFSFLAPCERGMAAQVCQDWARLMKKSTLWKSVDFNAFPLCPRTTRHDCSELCYAAYKSRIKKFIKYLQMVRPALHSLRFAFDIGDHKDAWLSCMKSLLSASRCIELEFANLNWKETPIRPYLTESLTWSTSDYNDLMHRHRHRQRLFINFFDIFSANAPNIRQLIIPFDWSPRSVKALIRLKKLEALVLEKYFLFQTLEQSALNQVFESLPKLRRVILEAWTPSSHGLVFYNIASPTVEYLDISQCRGFYVQSVDLPRVNIFKVSRHPWKSPFPSENAAVPCLYEVLAEGAPKLRQLNEHILRPDWQENTYEELEVVLKSACSCRLHKSSGVF